MISYPKRLIEVDLPIKKISAHARREKSIRHGHISTLHIWWARCLLFLSYPEEPHTAIEVRFIEVNGRATVGEIALTINEYKTAERLKKDFWLYVVYNCGTTPKIYPIHVPARLGWEPLVKVEHWYVGAEKIFGAEE